VIEWFRQLGRASRNLARIARQNPVWAVQGLVFAPFRFARHLFGVLVLMIAVGVVLILGSDGLMWYFGLLHYPTLVAIVTVLVWLAILLVPLRALFQPLILRYGNAATGSDTHGSARFATAGEAQALNDDHGLLIGRDVKTGKPMRYAGPAHLLTIAPTRGLSSNGTENLHKLGNADQKDTLGCLWASRAVG
jgi:type IV secretion system protein VirD4